MLKKSNFWVIIAILAAISMLTPGFFYDLGQLKIDFRLWTPPQWWFILSALVLAIALILEDICWYKEPKQERVMI